MSEFTSDIQVATNSDFSTLLVNETLPYRTARTFSKTDLPYGANLYARVRHNHPDTGTSNWSGVSTFSIISPATVIGVCLDNTDPKKKGIFSWIDNLGNQIQSFDFTKHPIFANISMVTADADRSPVTLTKIPLFYVRTATSGPAGTFAAGKKCWWISDQALADFRPAAAFKRTTQKDANNKYVISPFCYIGTFVGHTETVGGVSCIGSKRGQTVTVNATKSAFRTLITNRNNVSAGVSGFRMFDVWDLGVLRILLLIAKANSDFQTVWGDNVGATWPQSFKSGATNAKAVLKGTMAAPTVSFEDLWRGYWYHADLLSISSGLIDLVNPMDSTTAINFGSAPVASRTTPTSGGWIRDVLDCPFTIGDDVHDMQELFFPKTVVGSEALSSFPDYHYYIWASYGYPSITSIGVGGSSWYTTTPSISGLFHCDRAKSDVGLTEATAGSDMTAVRLSKN